MENIIQTINPTTCKQLKKYKKMNRKDASNIIEKSHKAFQSWKELSIKQRLKHLKNLGNELKKNRQKYAELMTKEMGKVITESLAEVDKCAWLIDELNKNAENWLKDESVKADGKKHIITYAPLGPIYIIMPWNYPFWQVFKVGMPPLVAGNTIILKHASNVTGTALAIEQATKNAGLPKDIFRVLIIDHDLSEKVISNQKISAISITGSVGSGKIVGAQAGKAIKKVVMELGGSDPFIVLKDANVDAAVKGAILGRTGNCGQVCIGAKRFIIHESLVKEFGEKFTKATKNRKMGDPLDPLTEIGPLVNKKAVETMEQFVKEAVKEGAILETGGKGTNEGSFFEPAVLTNVTPKMKVVTDETFGPIAPIISFKNETEAIKIANNSAFGLNASIWSKDLNRATKMARKIEVGGVAINSFSKSHPLLPLGGIKMSGFGRELGKSGIREFTNIKPINIYEVEK